MRPGDRSLAEQLDEALRLFDQEKQPLPGIQPAANRVAFLEQLVESVRRIKYIWAISKRDISNSRADPSSGLFDPLRAAALRKRQGQTDEAFWLVFLSVHFGKHRQAGWRLARDVYGHLGGGAHWDWARTSLDTQGFRSWLGDNQVTLKEDGTPRRFGNHRKYESLDAWSASGTGAVVDSYVKWVCPPRNHEMLIQEAQVQVGSDPRKMFDYLYRSMDAVARFGRTGKFDYLTMVGKLGLAAIQPGSTYMQGATGPLKGARLLFGGSLAAQLSRSDLDGRLVELGVDINVGMQVLEDALCNWQKSPTSFRRFRG